MRCIFKLLMAVVLYQITTVTCYPGRGDRPEDFHPHPPPPDHVNHAHHPPLGPRKPLFRLGLAIPGREFLEPWDGVMNNARRPLIPFLRMRHRDHHKDQELRSPMTPLVTSTLRNQEQQIHQEPSNALVTSIKPTLTNESLIINGERNPMVASSKPILKSQNQKNHQEDHKEDENSMDTSSKSKPTRDQVQQLNQEQNPTVTSMKPALKSQYQQMNQNQKSPTVNSLKPTIKDQDELKQQSIMTLTKPALQDQDPKVPQERPISSPQSSLRNKDERIHFIYNTNQKGDDPKANEIDVITFDTSTDDTSTEFTFTEDYESTTLDDGLGNRNGVPGAVVASLLG